jgi:geranylgeranyl pyrophosphate synthase
LASEKQKERLKSLYFDSSLDISKDEKIKEVTQIFKDVHVVEYAKQVIEAYRDLALSHLAACSPHSDKKQVLADMVEEYLVRES